MKRSGVFYIGAAALILVGLVLMATSGLMTSSQTEEITLPLGEYQSFKTPILLTGRVDGSFEAAPGYEIDVMVFGQSEYDNFVSTGLATPITEISAGNGTFSASASTFSRLYVVFENLGHQEASVTIQFNVTGITLNVFAVFVAMVVAGVVIILYGAKRGREPEPAARELAAEPSEAPRP